MYIQYIRTCVNLSCQWFWTFIICPMIIQFHQWFKTKTFVPTRHVYDSYEIQQTAQNEKKKTVVCPLVFKKWTENPLANTNTDSIFYNPEVYVKMVMESNRTVSEKFVAKWRRRKLYYTVQTNGKKDGRALLMEYDPIKRMFRYSSDTSFTYEILNQAAMQFVKTFQCLDLFVDTTVCPGFRSPLVDLYDKFYFDQDQTENKNATEQISNTLGRNALWERNRRLKKTNKTIHPFSPAEYCLNSFTRVKSIHDELNDSNKAVTQAGLTV